MICSSLRKDFILSRVNGMECTINEEMSNDMEGIALHWNGKSNERNLMCSKLNLY